VAIRFVEVAEARIVSGVDSTLISDADMTELIQDIEFQVEQWLNMDLTPHVEIDVHDGNNKKGIYTKRGPLLTVRALTTNGTTVDVSNVDHRASGRVRLLSTTTTPTFVKVDNGVMIQYVHGRVEWDKATETTTDAASTAGTSTALSVVSETGFTTNDWVSVKGTDGNFEATQITSTASGTITVDETVFAHNSGSLVRLYHINPTITRFIKVVVGIAANTRAVGESFDDITGYTIEDFQVQKGEPFTQFREAVARLIQERDEILKRLRPWPGIVS